MVTPRRRLTIQEREKGLPSRCALRRCYYYSEIGKIDEYKPLKEMGFDLYDVVRDGNCGFYSLLLAQRMYGLSAGNPQDEKVGYPIVMAMRMTLYHKMKKDGEKLFANIHVTSDDDATEADKEFHSYFNSMFGMENFEDISRTFWDEDITNPKERYRHPLKNEHLQMAVDYGPLLFAVIFKIPVAQIILYRYPEGDCWNTLYVDGTTYDSEDHTVAVDFSFGIQTYEDYPNMPVIYLLFENKHYMLLEQPKDGFKVTVKDRKGNNSREALVCVYQNAMRNPPTSDNDNRKKTPVPEKAVMASAVRLETGHESESSETGHQSEISRSDESSNKEKTAAEEKRLADEKTAADEKRQADERTDPSTSDNAGLPKIGGRPPAQSIAPATSQETEQVDENNDDARVKEVAKLPEYSDDSIEWVNLLCRVRDACSENILPWPRKLELLDKYAKIGGRVFVGDSGQGDMCPEDGLGYYRIKYKKPTHDNPGDSFQVEVVEKENLVTKEISQEEARKVFSLQYLTFLKHLPNNWTNNLNDVPRDTNAPQHIISNEGARFTQGGGHSRLACSVASALHYCGFSGPALWMWQQGKVLSGLPMDQALQIVSSFMSSAVPSIGGTTKFMIRTARKRKRYLTIRDVIQSPTPYPWLIIPRRENGVTDHALCVVDDLIFDAIRPKALLLCQESFDWIFNDRPITIHSAIRFDHNLLPKGSGNRYTRECQFHGRGGI